ncbi:MAG: hypothetical protein R2761_28015 [Acidimicrobiales bacterium]
MLVYLFFAMLPFGTFAVVPAQMSGGLSLLGAPMTALLIAIREFGLQPDGSRRLAALAFGCRPGRLLVCYWSVAALVTAFAPRFFQGQFEVIPMSATVLRPTPLAPTLQNFSQLAYLTVSVLAVFAFASVFQRPVERSHLTMGLLLSGLVTIATGVVDLLSTVVPIQRYLQAFKTAQYRLLDDAILADGTRRVVGLMPEASAFGGLSITLFAMLYFTRQSFDSPSLRRRSGWTTAGLGVMAIISTSSAGYVALAVVVVLLLLDWFSRTAGLTKGAMVRRGMRREMIVMLTVLAAVAVALMLAPSVFDPAVERVQDSVFAKTQTESYVERTAWTATSLEAAVSSRFVGVGIGSTRASNVLVAVLASVGVPGLLLYCGFLAHLFRSPVRSGAPQDAVIVRALRWSYPPVLVLGLLAGTSADFGVFDGLRWGVLLGALAPSRALAQRVAVPALRPAVSDWFRSAADGRVL